MRWNKEQCLSDLNHDLSLFKRVVASVLSYLEVRAKTLSAEYHYGNWEALEREAHFLKGTSQQLHFFTLLDLTRQIEKLAPLHKVDDLLLAKFECEVNALLLELKHF